MDYSQFESGMGSFGQDDQNQDYDPSVIDAEYETASSESSNQQPEEEEEQIQDETFFQRKTGLVSDMMELAEGASSGQADIMLQSIEQFSKSQIVRFFDISVIGPILLYYAFKGKLNPIERSVLALIGVGTVVYNGRNFLKNRKIMSSPDLVALKNELKERV